MPTSTTTKVAVFLRKFGKFCLNSQEFTRIQSNSQKFIVKFLNLCVCHVSLERFAQSANKNFQAKYFFTLKSNNSQNLIVFEYGIRSILNDVLIMQIHMSTHRNHMNSLTICKIQGILAFLHMNSNMRFYKKRTAQLKLP